MLSFGKKKSADEQATIAAEPGATAKPTQVEGDASIAALLRRNTLGLVLASVLGTAAVIAGVSYVASRSAIEKETNEQLSSLASQQSLAIEEYMGNLQNLLLSTAQLSTVTNAATVMMNEFGKLKTKVDPAVAKTALSAYYSNEFGKEYANKNKGVANDPLKFLSQLSDDAVAAQYVYIANNKNALGKKNELIDAADGSEYAAAHARMQNLAKNLYQRFGFYDIFVVDPRSANVVYTYFKELDYGTNLQNGPWAKSGLADAFRSGLKLKEGEAALTDFKPYVPSYNDQAAFMSVPMYENGSLAAVVIIQVPIDKINRVMTFAGKWEGTGLGKTGQTLLVSKEGGYRSISRAMSQAPDVYVAGLASGAFSKVADEVKSRGSDIGLVSLGTDIVEAFNEATSKVGVYKASGKEVVAAFAPVKLLNQDFRVVAEFETDEAFAPLRSLLAQVFGIAALVAAVLGTLALLFSRKVVRAVTQPLAQVTSTVEKLQAGNFEARVGLDSKDEFGKLSKALDNLLDDRLKTLTEAAKQSDQLNNSVIDIMQAVGTIATTKDLGVKMPVAEDLTGAISDALNLLTDETSKVLRNVGAVSQEVAQATLAVRSQSESANKAAEREQEEVETAATELASAAQSLTSMAQRAMQANEVAERAVKTTAEAMRIVGGTVTGISESRDLIRETEKRIKRLGERSQEIGQVVSIIQGIAERTGILALNASMHAAAAGEAGRSFAVVAEEVKRLSESARESTSQIGRLVGSIQSETNDTVIAMNQAIGQVVEISKLADDAGREMKRTQDETEALAANVRDIAKSSVEQARVSSGLQERARLIKESSAETARQLQSQASETKRLVDYAKSLLQEVSVFKVPQ